MSAKLVREPVTYMAPILAYMIFAAEDSEMEPRPMFKIIENVIRDFKKHPNIPNISKDVQEKRDAKATALMEALWFELTDYLKVLKCRFF